MSSLTLPELRTIRRFLRARARPPEIARKMGLPVEMVVRVASDRRLRHRKLDRLLPEHLPDIDAPPDYVPAQLRRCPGCGAMVYRWPCLACRLLGEALSPPVQDGVTERRREGETEGRREEQSCQQSCCLSLPVPPSLCPSVSPSHSREISHVA